MINRRLGACDSNDAIQLLSGYADHSELEHYHRYTREELLAYALMDTRDEVAHLVNALNHADRFIEKAGDYLSPKGREERGFTKARAAISAALRELDT